MEQLNDDIILLILDYVPLYDQISWYKAMPKLEEVIKDNWRIQFKRKLIINFVECPVNADDFRKILLSVFDILEVLILKFITLELFEVLCQFRFRKAHNLRFMQMSPNEILDKDLIQLQSAFPNLRSFSPHGHLTGEYLCDLWPDLEELSVRNILRIKQEHLIEIFRKLHLKSLDIAWLPHEARLPRAAALNFWKLQRIVLDSHLLEWLIEHHLLRHMKNLRELSLTDPPTYGIMEDLVKSVTNEKRSTLLEEHIFLDNNLPVHAAKRGFDKLWRFTLFSNLHNTRYPYPKETNYLLAEIAGIQFGNLRHVILSNIILIDDDDALRLFTNAHNLELLSFEHCQTSFQELLLDMSSTFRCQKSQLTINWYHNIYEPTLLDLGFPPNFQRSFMYLNLCELRLIGEHQLVNITAESLYKSITHSVSLIFEPDN